MHTSIHSEVAKITRHPHAMVYGLYRALPGDRAFLPPSPRGSCLPQNLTPASRRQDHTTSPSASVPFVIGTSSVHRIPPRVRDDREPPLRWDETAEISEVIWGQVEADYFSGEDWTGQISLIRNDKSVCWRMSMEPSRWFALWSGRTIFANNIHCEQYPANNIRCPARIDCCCKSVT